LDTELPTEDKKLKPEEMIDRTFLMPEQEDGTRDRAKIVELIKDHRHGMETNPDRVKFKCIVGDKYEEIVSYNDVINFIEKDDMQTPDGTPIFKYKRIIGHKRVYPGQKDHKDSMYNARMLWEGDQITWEPVGKVIKDDPVTLAVYVKEKGLQDTPGFKHKRIHNIIKNQKKLLRSHRQMKLHSFRTKPVYMFGYQVPRNYEQAMELDARNGNNKWQTATDIELGQIDEYETFEDKGKGYKPGPDFKKIRCHLVYAVKHDGRHKARFVAGGHLTETPIDSVYSSVVSLRGIRILTFIAELNDMETWSTDIGNAYLESLTKEKVYIIAGPEFGARAGHTLIVRKALYGLKSSGKRWHERLADVLRQMGFVASYAEPDIWMRHKGDHYEYI
jgi:hypothetical protein